MQHERRRYPRVKRTIRLEMQKKRLMLMRGPKNTAEIIDVSRSGARIRTRIDLKEGEGVILALKTKAIRHTLEFGAKVIWVKEVKGQQGIHNQAGLRFQAVSAEMSSLLFRMAVGQMEE
jgi:hypothetical protein